MARPMEAVETRVPRRAASTSAPLKERKEAKPMGISPARTAVSRMVKSMLRPIRSPPRTTTEAAVEASPTGAEESWGSGKCVRVHNSLFFATFEPGSPEMSQLPSDSRVFREAKPVTRLRWLHTEATCRYVPFCKDFGPYNLGSTAKFCLSLVQAQRMGQTVQQPNRSVVIFCERSPENLSNAAFVIGAHLIINMGLSADDAWAPFARQIAAENFADFHDATWEEQCFPLKVLDVLRGVHRAMAAGYICEYFRGFDEAVYNHYDHPLNGDMQEVVAGKFIAFAGPTKEVEGDSGYYRTLTPAAFKEPFQRFGVSAVVRLNERKKNDYDAEDFTRMGLKHHDLIFEDCTNPSSEVIMRFLHICEKSEGGVIAVHCKAGLGRTGTLIALWMMKHHKFTAREAIGWLRFVRPGSVIHDQQQFLCDMEEAMHEAGDAARERKRSRATHKLVGGKGTGTFSANVLQENEIKSFFSPKAAVIPSVPLRIHRNLVEKDGGGGGGVDLDYSSISSWRSYDSAFDSLDDMGMDLEVPSSPKPKEPSLRKKTLHKNHASTSDASIDVSRAGSDDCDSLDSCGTPTAALVKSAMFHTAPASLADSARIANDNTVSMKRRAAMRGAPPPPPKNLAQTWAGGPTSSSGGLDSFRSNDSTHSACDSATFTSSPTSCNSSASSKGYLGRLDVTPKATFVKEAMHFTAPPSVDSARIAKDNTDSMQRRAALRSQESPPTKLPSLANTR